MSLAHSSPEIVKGVLKRVQSRAGLAVEAGGFRKNFERILARRLAHEGAGASRYLERLLDDEALFDEFCEELTVGETYFFRHPAQWRTFEREILPELLRERQTIRLWSSAAATGEEPYTVAVIACRLLPQTDWGRIRILATDFNRKFLAHAEAGVYSRRSVRHVPPADLHRFFSVREKGNYLLNEEVKRLVSFERLNLHDPSSYPRQETGTRDLDVIFCRNVLIYFDPEGSRRVVERLTQALRPGGYLILGPSEHGGERPAGLARCQWKDGIVYQRRDEAARAEPGRTASRGSSPATGRSHAVEAAAPSRPTPPDLAREAWAHANSMRFAEAIDVGRQAVLLDPLNSDLYLLMGVSTDRLGDRMGAAQWFQKALYLDSRHLLSRFYLANAYRGLGEAGAAEREYRTLLRYLHGRPAGESIERDDRLTVGALRSVCEAAIDRLREPAMEKLA